VVSGVAVVTFYVVPGALAARLHAAAGSITSVALPTASELFSRGDLRRVQVLYQRATWLTALFLVSVGTPALVFAPNILEHWVGSVFKEKSTEALQILIATYFVLGLSAVAYWITMAAGRPRSTAVFNFASASLNVGAIFLLVPSYGVVGAAFAYLISVITVPGFIWYVERRVLELARSPWPRIAWRLTIGVVAQVAACLALRPFAENIISTIGLVLLCILVAPAVLYGFGFIEADDKALLGRVFGRQPAGGAAR
jgi:O-antigen/teichoic acid export membrane protein